MKYHVVSKDNAYIVDAGSFSIVNDYTFFYKTAVHDETSQAIGFVRNADMVIPIVEAKPDPYSSDLGKRVLSDDFPGLDNPSLRD